MRKKYFFIAGIVLLCLAGWLLYKYQLPRTNIANKTADVTIVAMDIYSQYQKDEPSSNKKFLDKIIEVKGEVADVQQTDTTMSVQLKGGEMGGINCSVNMAHKRMTLPIKGSTITIKGLCTGYIMDVNLVDCVLEK